MVLQRVIQAPRSIVWGAWMNPETLPQWWGPEGFSCRTKRIDLRTGGEWVFDMIAPDGTVFPNHHLYSEVRPEERIGYTLLLGRERAEACRRLGLVRGSGRGNEGNAGHGIQHGCRVPGGEGLRCRGTGTANSGQTGTLRRIPLKCYGSCAPSRQSSNHRGRRASSCARCECACLRL